MNGTADTSDGLPAKRMLSDRVYARLRRAILRGEFTPGQALKPQELATAHGVSLAVVREALVRAVGDGIADRLPNRGFAVPAFSDRRWQEIAEARRAVEPAALRMAIARGDLDWEARVRAAHHRLAGTPPYAAGEGGYPSEAWSGAHHAFHRTLLKGCGNSVLLDTFERMWTAGELARRWSVLRSPDRDHATEHRRLEEAALARDADRAVELLARHLTLTAEGLTGPSPDTWDPAAAEQPVGKPAAAHPAAGSSAAGTPATGSPAEASPAAADPGGEPEGR